MHDSGDEFESKDAATDYNVAVFIIWNKLSSNSYLINVILIN